jgi:glycosyltransferase involved in cell wall biosynthesis
VVHLGELTRAETYDFVAGAAALLFPVNWREPFGMVLIEAMACGTPVLATNRGAVPEVVLDGVTGFVRDTAAELAPLIDRIDEIDRKACRRHVTEHFSRDALVRGYTRLLAPSRERRESRFVAPMVFRAPVHALGPVHAPRSASPHPGRRRQPARAATGR